MYECLLACTCLHLVHSDARSVTEVTDWSWGSQGGFYELNLGHRKSGQCSEPLNNLTSSSGGSYQGRLTRLESMKCQRASLLLTHWLQLRLQGSRWVGETLGGGCWRARYRYAFSLTGCLKENFYLRRGEGKKSWVWENSIQSICFYVSFAEWLLALGT